MTQLHVENLTQQSTDPSTNRPGTSQEAEKDQVQPHNIEAEKKEEAKKRESEEELRELFKRVHRLSCDGQIGEHNVSEAESILERVRNISGALDTHLLPQTISHLEEASRGGKIVTDTRRQHLETVELAQQLQGWGAHVSVQIAERSGMLSGANGENLRNGLVAGREAAYNELAGSMLSGLESRVALALSLSRALDGNGAPLIGTESALRDVVHQIRDDVQRLEKIATSSAIESPLHSTHRSAHPFNEVSFVSPAEQQSRAA